MPGRLRLSDGEQPIDCSLLKAADTVKPPFKVIDSISLTLKWDLSCLSFCMSPCIDVLEEQLKRAFLLIIDKCSGSKSDVCLLDIPPGTQKSLDCLLMKNVNRYGGDCEKLD